MKLEIETDFDIYCACAYRLKTKVDYSDLGDNNNIKVTPCPKCSPQAEEIRRLNRTLDEMMILIKGGALRTEPISATSMLLLWKSSEVTPVEEQSRKLEMPL